MKKLKTVTGEDNEFWELEKIKRMLFLIMKKLRIPQLKLRGTEARADAFLRTRSFNDTCNDGVLSYLTSYEASRRKRNVRRLKSLYSRDQSQFAQILLKSISGNGKSTPSSRKCSLRPLPVPRRLKAGRT